MTKLLFASLLTAALVLAQQGGGTRCSEGKTAVKSTTGGRKITKTKVRTKGTGKPSDYNEASQHAEATKKAAKDTKQPSTTPPQ